MLAKNSLFCKKSTLGTIQILLKTKQFLIKIRKYLAKHEGAELVCGWLMGN